MTPAKLPAVVLQLSLPVSQKKEQGRIIVVRTADWHPPTRSDKILDAEFEEVFSQHPAYKSSFSERGKLVSVRV